MFITDLEKQSHFVSFFNLNTLKWSRNAHMPKTHKHPVSRSLSNSVLQWLHRIFPSQLSISFASCWGAPSKLATIPVFSSPPLSSSKFFQLIKSIHWIAAVPRIYCSPERFPPARGGRSTYDMCWWGVRGEGTELALFTLRLRSFGSRHPVYVSLPLPDTPWRSPKIRRP